MARCDLVRAATTAANMGVGATCLVSDLVDSGYSSEHGMEVYLPIILVLGISVTVYMAMQKYGTLPRNSIGRER